MTNRCLGPLVPVLALALIALLGCPGKRTRSVGKGGGGDGDNAGSAQNDAGPKAAVLRKVLHLTIELQVVDPDADPVQTEVDLVMTNETGANDRTEIGEFPGECTDTSASHRHDPMNPILAVDCTTSDPGIALRFVHRQGEIIVLRAKMFEGEELSFDEHRRVALPEAVPVTTDYDSAAETR